MRSLLALVVCSSLLVAFGCKGGDQTASNGPTDSAAPTTAPSMSPSTGPSSAPTDSAAPSSAAPSPDSTTGGGGGGNNSAVVGTWKPDVNSLKMTIADKSAKGQETLKTSIEMAKKSLASSSVTFNADGTYNSTGAGNKSDGKYTMDGNNIKMVDSKNPNEPQPTMTVSGSKISMHFEQAGNSMDLDLVKG